MMQIIMTIKNNSGEWCYDKDEIASLAISFFKDLYKEEDSSSFDDVLCNIPKILSEAHNNFLGRLPDEAEIKTASRVSTRRLHPALMDLEGAFIGVAGK
ncbi:unnamed protein product [Cuscuta europaea]|uniref:Uncharacterized protein n=1 Tax=Cuscuta europaea TaxID=41803 RepID=A0A9P0Z519_CUSEU|nr:unnamed protein product [Cuscuta europaea]